MVFMSWFLPFFGGAKLLFSDGEKMKTGKVVSTTNFTHLAVIRDSAQHWFFGYPPTPLPGIREPGILSL